MISRHRTPTFTPTATRRAVALTILLLSGLAAVPAAQADGFIVIEDAQLTATEVAIGRRPVSWERHMPLSVKNHFVECNIIDGVATTKIDQVFHNPTNRQLEGTYIFPFPDDVVIQKFSMFMNGKEVQGEVLDSDKARNIYEDIVRKMQDPALLEYAGSRMYKARVFPIPANGDVRIKLDYSQVVRSNAGLFTYTYPLNTEKFSATPLENVAVTVRINSQRPITTVFCPTHQASVDRKSDTEYVVGYEAKRVLPDTDFTVNYKLTENKDFSLVTLTHREGDEPGYFMARITPDALTRNEKPLPKDICFVIDTSGSMSGKKIEQARDALRFCLEHLNESDRFSIVAFSTEVRPYRKGLTAAGRDSVNDAKQYVSELEAIGGTAINDALLTAIQAGRDTAEAKGRPYMIVFLTDGLPTVGEKDVDKILTNVKKENKGNIRLFVFGVGHDVNTRLLDTLAEDNHGARQYVSENEDLELKLSDFYTMIAHPILSDLELKFDDDLKVTDVYPKRLPDLFRGSELVLLGRYAGTGASAITLTGNVGEGKERSFTWEKTFAKANNDQEHLPRLWASRKIGFLLDEMRLNGENAELKEEVVTLAKRFGILTPYTSFLVLEDDQSRLARGEALDAPAATRMLNQSREMRFGAERARSSFYAMEGKDAVAASKSLGRLKTDAPPAAEAENEIMLYGLGGDFGGYGGAGTQIQLDAKLAEHGGKAASPIRFVGAKTFYRDGEKWIDSEYDGKAETIKVKLFSDDYFKLTAQYAELGKYLAIGKLVIVVIDGKVYETVEA